MIMAKKFFPLSSPDEILIAFDATEPFGEWRKRFHLTAGHPRPVGRQSGSRCNLT